MREGSLEPPIRHPIDWQDPNFTDEAAIDAELRRVFDICHTCRRCFNLCDSFPRLFNLIDAMPSGELHEVPSPGLKPVVDACTLCDLCFMTKCPYVPPHPFNLDFPHLMLRYRAAEFKRGEVPFVNRQLTETDRNGNLARPVAAVANWATDTANQYTRPLLEKVAGIHREAHLPKFHGRTLTVRARTESIAVDRTAPAAGRKAVLYATCFANYNNPSIGLAAQGVLARNGVETEILYPGCCGMPQLEQGDLARVAANAVKVAAALESWIDRGFDVIALVPSCALMMKFEWPLLVPRDAPELAAVRKLAKATFDVSEYIVDIARHEGLAPGLKALEGGVTLHIACHSRAQNIGQKAAEMLRLLPDPDVKVIERCSGHGGSWGILKNNFPTAIKIGKPVAAQAVKNGKAWLASECPLAGAHILQGMERIDDNKIVPPRALHPIELFAHAYGIRLPAEKAKR